MIKADISLRDGDTFSVFLAPSFADNWDEVPESEWCRFSLQPNSGDPALLLMVRKGDVRRIVREVKHDDSRET